MDDSAVTRVRVSIDCAPALPAALLIGFGGLVAQ